MNRIDKIITSRTFNLLPNVVKWIWSPVSKRQHFLMLREVYEIFGESDFQPYADVYGKNAAIRRYFKSNVPSDLEAASTAPSENHHRAMRRGL